MRSVLQKTGIAAACAMLLLASYPVQTSAQKKSRLQDRKKRFPRNYSIKLKRLLFFPASSRRPSFSVAGVARE